MESTGSSTSSQHPQLPPGFRFHPTDEELVVHYLKRKAASAPLPVTIIAEVDLYKFDPWELPSKATFGLGEQEWYFFSPRERKYPNGTRPNRAATSGYWKATGTDKPILTSNGNHKVGVKKALVFYGGKPPKGIKTNWIMHEYRLVDNNSLTKPLVPDLANKKNSSRLDDWVLCRVYKKSNAQKPMERDREDSTSYGSLFEYDEHFFEGMLPGETLQQNTCVSQYAASSSSKAANLSIVVSPSTTSTNTFPTKHVAMPPQFWNEASASASGSMASSSGKLLSHGNLSSGSSATDDHKNSFVSLLNQIPQSLPFNTNNSALLGDGTTLRQQFQLPSINWNS